MEQKNKELYIAPVAEIVEVNSEGIICASKDEYVPESF